MTLVQLRCLVAIADAGLNITLAAERVHATQPGLSKQLKQLEDELGFKLFVRKGKSLDAFCPMGPIVVTADEFGDPHEKRLWTRVNGVVKQDGVSSDMLFRIDAIIESLSKGLTVEAGDIIATGTPDGVGFSRTPPEFLRPGDLLESEVEGIGVMRNRIVGAVVAAPVGD